MGSELVSMWMGFPGKPPKNKKARNETILISGHGAVPPRVGTIKLISFQYIHILQYYSKFVIKSSDILKFNKKNYGMPECQILRCPIYEIQCKSNPIFGIWITHTKNWRNNWNYMKIYNKYICSINGKRNNVLAFWFSWCNNKNTKREEEQIVLLITIQVNASSSAAQGIKESLAQYCEYFGDCKVVRIDEVKQEQLAIDNFARRGGDPSGKRS